ncbi:MAG TPA: PH domain-containing protein, partial [Actinomycetales bacterium]|nr:PH domain-containing protein [Actinomycetales bacterium]
PFLARLVGLAEIRVEVAGASGTAVRIAYLKEAEAQRLRNQILARSAGLEVDENAPAPEAPENELFQVPFGRLIGSLVMSANVIVPVLLIVLFGVIAILVRSPEPLLANFPIVFVLGIQVWQRLNRGAFFRAATSPDGVRITHGLLEQRRQTVPPGRIQTVRFTQPLLWRPFDWWRVEMNIAGYGQANPSQALVNDLLPVGKRDDALRALWLVVPDFSLDDTGAVLNHAMVGRDEVGGFTTSPRRVRPIDPLVYRSTAFRLTPPALLIRRGRLTRKMMVVPHERIQSISAYQGPLQRLLRVAKFQIDTTLGPVLPIIPHLDVGTAAQLVEEQTERSRQARARDRSERWMAADGRD